MRARIPNLVKVLYQSSQQECPKRALLGRIQSPYSQSLVPVRVDYIFLSVAAREQTYAHTPWISVGYS